MKNPLIALVAVDGTVFHIDKPYSYLIPENLSTSVKIGCRVTVPFGGGNRKRQGLVLGFSDSKDLEKLKPIIELIDSEPILSDKMLSLVKWVKNHYFCTYYDVVKAVLPPGINYKYVPEYSISSNVTEEKIEQLENTEKAVALMLFNNKVTLTAQKIYAALGLEAESKILDSLEKQGIVKKTENAVRKTGDASMKMIKAVARFDGALTAKQKSVYEKLTELEACSVKELCYFCGCTSAVANTLVKKGAAEFFEQEYFRRAYEVNIKSNTESIELTDEQTDAFNTLKELSFSGKPNAALLYGVTGSGKTQVFLKLCDEVLNSGKSVIIMVPEIALTPQTLAVFHSRYGNKVAVFHSAMSQGKRLDEWKRVKSGEASIAIGTRTAVFAPFDNLGLIVMDEEQEHTYKSDKSPRFHARDVAKFRASQHNCLLLLASATPSVESFSAAKSGRYTLCELTNRYGESKLPEVITVDTRNELASGNKGAISRELYEKLTETLENSNQAILLLNRRGFNTYVSCPSCGYVLSCKNCSISLTYHSANNRLMCHYCGASEEYTNICPSCGSNHMRYSGQGTQKIEQELALLFPNARILRLDADSTMTRNSFDEGLQKFSKGEYDILLGTQMVAKGLNFPKVTLVGVLGADQSMYSDDFRSFEKTFSLLTQVVGRSGRGDQKGQAIVQTANPDNKIISLAAKQDYEAFYNDEILTRKLMVYPPYCDIVAVCVSSLNKTAAEQGAKTILDNIKKEVEQNFPNIKLIVLGPSAPAVPKVNNKYRYRLFIKTKNNGDFREMLKKVLTDFMNSGNNKNISVYADVNPESM